jgi:hypothetical protein
MPLGLIALLILSNKPINGPPLHKEVYILDTLPEETSFVLTP